MNIYTVAVDIHLCFGPCTSFGCIALIARTQHIAVFAPVVLNSHIALKNRD